MIRVVSREDIDEMILGTKGVLEHVRLGRTEPWDLISFCNAPEFSLFSEKFDPLQEKPNKLKELGCESILKIYCYDLIHRYTYVEGEKQFNPLPVFNEDDARNIVDFISKRPLGKDLVVHCDAGISRSMAVGLFVAGLYGENIDHFIELHPKMWPNSLILGMLVKEWAAKSNDNT